MNNSGYGEKSFAQCDLPGWLSGNNPQDYLGVARLRPRKANGPRWIVQTEESYYRRSADLVGTVEISGPTTEIAQTDQLQKLLAAEPSLRSTYEDRQQFTGCRHGRSSSRPVTQRRSPGPTTAKNGFTCCPGTCVSSSKIRTWCSDRETSPPSTPKCRTGSAAPAMRPPRFSASSGDLANA